MGQPANNDTNNNNNNNSNNNVVSPVLDALGALAETREDDTAYRTGTWAKSIPFGKSPPNEFLDGEFASGSQMSVPAHPERGGFSNPSSTSPPPRVTRPLSYGNGYLSSNPSRHQSVDRQKSFSLSSPFQNSIPPPHLPQAHFYGAPDIDLPLFSGQHRSTSDAHYSFCAFDTITSPLSKSSRMGGTVLLSGFDGALEVLALEDRKTRLLGKIVGLNGRVIDAKIVTYNSEFDPFASSRPHIVVTLHGPSPNVDDESGTSSSNGSEVAENVAVSSGRQTSMERREPRDGGKYYQTRVEVYSLRNGDHISTLFASKSTPCFENIPGFGMFAPPPAGSLRLYASGNYVVLASGQSGEVFIYGISSHSESNPYRCLGKTWTSTQSKESRRHSTSSSSTDADGSQNDSPHGPASWDIPILSLKGRWLAVVPPSSASYRPSIRGSVPSSLIQGKVFGLETRSPPARPTVTCALDWGEGESFLNKVARGVTQELVKGARWMGDQGLQAWNNYWSKEQQSQTGSSLRRPHMMDIPPQNYNMFPPTHAQDTQTTSPAEPELVSIIDLRKLEESGETKNTSLDPFATFQVPSGCSFLSFSPNGLMLLTASKKGDVQYVWDLMQVRHCRSATLNSDENSPPSANVRQVARYARLTTSTIVDVIWNAPGADRLAIITSKGTVHVFDMPRSAFQWPPFRRARRPLSDSPYRDSLVDGSSERADAAHRLSAAIKLVGGKTQPILAAVRGRTPSGNATFSGMGRFGISSAAGVKSGKAVAAGLSKSVGAATGTVNTLRHAGENRLHLSGLSRDPVPSRVTWVSHKGQAFLGLVDNGFFRLYAVRHGVSTQKNRQLQSVIAGKEVEFRLPHYLQNPCGPIPVTTFDADMTVQASFGLPSSNPQSSTAAKFKCQPLSQAEIETNAPYQPFHTDQRVNLHVFPPGSETNSHSGPWTFGDDIPMSRLHVRPFSVDDDDDTQDERHHGNGGMENLISLGNSTDNVEEIVITTRRKKQSSSFDPPDCQTEPDDGFFEDDCEVLDFARDRV